MDQLLQGYGSDSSADSDNDDSKVPDYKSELLKCNDHLISKRKADGDRGLHADPKRARAEPEPGAADVARLTAAAPAAEKDAPRARGAYAGNGAVSAAAKRRPAARLPDPTALLAAASGDELHGLLAPGARVAVAVAAAGAGAAAAVAGALVAPGPAAAAASASASAQPPPQIQIQDPAPPLDPYGGRVRRFPHVVGNYATVVLLPVQGLALEGPLDALYRKLRRLLPDLEPTTQQQQPAAAAAAGGALAGGRGRGAGGGGREAAAPCNGGYHVSLSRPVPITRAQIEPLTSELSRRLAAAGSSFPLSLCGLRAFVNDEGTRSFVSAMVAAGERRVVGLVRAVDGAFAAHGLPTFYEDPLPHVSVGWLVGDQRARIQAAVDKFNKQHQQAPAKAHSRPAAGAAEPGAAGAAGSRDAAAGAQPPGAAAFSLGPWQASRAVCVVGQREYEVWRAAAPPPTTRGGTGGGTEG